MKYSLFYTKKGISLKRYRSEKPIIVFKENDVVITHKKDGTVSKILIKNGELEI